MTNETKIYSKQTLKGWLHWFLDIWEYHLTMRLAWKPALLLEKYRKLYGSEWDKKYLELLWMLKEIWDDWKSPFVFYVNDKK
jgi:hypothetical protein